MTTIARSRLAVPGLVVLLGVLLGGCTSDNKVAPAPDSSTIGAPVSGAQNAQDAADFAATVACLRDRGWDIVVDDNDGSDGTTGFSAPGVSEDQYSAFLADSDDCNRQNAHIKSLDDYTDEEWKTGYAKIVASAECLRGQGYDIPETPSFQAWKESFYNGDGSQQWIPWGFPQLQSLSVPDAKALEAICPQVGLSTS